LSVMGWILSDVATWLVRMALRAVLFSVMPGQGVMVFSGEICVRPVIDGFRRYRSTAPNIAEIAENKKRTN